MFFVLCFIVLKDSLYYFAIKRHFFNFNTDSRISICSRGTIFKVCISGILNFSIDKEKKKILLNLRSISFIGNRSLFFVPLLHNTDFML